MQLGDPVKSRYIDKSTSKIDRTNDLPMYMTPTTTDVPMSAENDADIKVKNCLFK